MLQAVNDKVIVELPKQKEISAGGIILPAGAQDDKSTKSGKVINVGRGTWDLKSGSWVSIDCCKGDTVYFGKYAGNDVTYNGKEYKVIKESEILAVDR